MVVRGCHGSRVLLTEFRQLVDLPTNIHCGQRVSLRDIFPRLFQVAFEVIGLGYKRL